MKTEWNKKYGLLVAILIINMLASFSVSKLLEPMFSADFVYVESGEHRIPPTNRIITPLQKVSFICGMKRVEMELQTFKVIKNITVLNIANICFVIAIVNYIIYRSLYYMMDYRHGSDGKK